MPMSVSRLPQAQNLKVNNSKANSSKANSPKASSPKANNSKVNNPEETASDPGENQNGHAAQNGHEEQNDLSKRELQIVEQIAAGLTNQEISEKLEISKRTVDNHVSNVLNKTATGNRVALVRWALQSGKVCIDELNCCHLPEA